MLRTDAAAIADGALRAEDRDETDAVNWFVTDPVGVVGRPRSPTTRSMRDALWAVLLTALLHVARRHVGRAARA